MHRSYMSTRYWFVEGAALTIYFCAQCKRQRKLGVFKILSAYERIKVHARRPPATRTVRCSLTLGALKNDILFLII